MNPERQAESDPRVRAAVMSRREALAVGTLALPNLLLRSVFTLGLLYALLGLVLIAVVEAGYATPELAVLIGVAVAIAQFVFGPWIMDLSLRWLYRMRWVEADELPGHLCDFVQYVCEGQRIRFPDFGVIDDGAPQAFTYGHHPNNARIVISRGLMDILQPAELEAVVAHELGHVRNWDMALMTVAQLVPLLLYYVYRVGIRVSRATDKKGRGVAIAVAVGAYVVYIVSEYIVLWFSRTREYFADRFAGSVTGNPNALVTALVKIAYGLAAQEQQEASEAEAKKDKKAKQRELAGVGPLGALNIFDRHSSVNMVVCAGGGGTGSSGAACPDLELVKGAMQWDLWNPWAGFYELNSTHPLIAKRINYLSDQAAAMGQEALVLFDRVKPESYWDEFLADVFVWLLPVLGFLAGVAICVGGLATQAVSPAVLGLALILGGAGYLIKTFFAYRSGIFPNLTVAALMGHVKVSPVRPVPATLAGTIIGKGVPGLIWSEDFVMRDSTGILFLDYRQPLAIWNFLFGLIRAGQYQGRQVRVTGWFRRAPVPYMEIYQIETLDDGRKRTCYAWHARIATAAILIAAGIALSGWLATT
ncbi:MAG: M48 family metalloprotease [Planctomycetes bacterium]|nr:M48 family metalloprotease [Planctomycetota bacterium]